MKAGESGHLALAELPIYREYARGPSVFRGGGLPLNFFIPTPLYLVTCVMYVLSIQFLRKVRKCRGHKEIESLLKEMVSLLLLPKSSGGHCVLKWVLRGHFKPSLNATK